jgi:hypothetical protein
MKIASAPKAEVQAKELPKAGIPLAVPALGSLGLSGLSALALRKKAQASFIAENL